MPSGDKTVTNTWRVPISKETASPDAASRPGLVRSFLQKLDARPPGFLAMTFGFLAALMVCEFLDSGVRTCSDVTAEGCPYGEVGIYFLVFALALCFYLSSITGELDGPSDWERVAPGIIGRKETRFRITFDPAKYVGYQVTWDGVPIQGACFQEIDPAKRYVEDRVRKMLAADMKP